VIDKFRYLPPLSGILFTLSGICNAALNNAEFVILQKKYKKQMAEINYKTIATERSGSAQLNCPVFKAELQIPLSKET
jgi:hypothetical protein